MMPEVVWKRNDVVYIRIIFVTLSVRITLHWS